MRFRCRICGQDLLEQPTRGVCNYCGREEPADWTCPGGHYTCEACRTACPCDLLERTCLHSDARDPLELAELLLRHPTFQAYYVNGRMIISEDLPTFEALCGEIDVEIAKGPSEWQD